MTVSEVDEVFDELVVAGLVSNDHLVGCTPDQIDELMQDQGVSTLPASYLRFLERAGRKAAPVFVGSKITYPSLLGVKHSSEDLLAENSASWSLKKTDFVIQMHQGYQIFWFDTSIVEPEIWMYTEGDEGPTAHFAGFIDYLKVGSPLEQHYRTSRIL